MIEQERFMDAMHKMRDSFLVLKDRQPWGSCNDENGAFFDGYRDVRQLFGDVLLQRDVTGRLAGACPRPSGRGEVNQEDSP